MFTKKLSLLNQKNILIIGMAREGLSTVEFLLSHLPQAKITLTDQKDLTQLDVAWTSLLKQNSQLKYQTAEQVREEKFDVVFKTPGIPHKVLTQTYKIDLQTSQLYSNTQLFFDLLSEFKVKPLTIGITGTKGKSTTTSMIYHVLKNNLENVYLAGNIGVPPLRLLEKADPQQENIFVLEMSCHQLADLNTSPRFAVVLDISPDHLDYYPTFEDYFKAKTAICRFQKDDDLVFFNGDSKTARRMAELSHGKHHHFSLKDTDLVEFIKSTDSKLVGEHNIYNTMPAVLIARQLDIADQKIAESIASFTPVSHRLEHVATHNGVKYYDDSASSAPEATVAALHAFADQKIVLIAGGSEKGVEFGHLAEEIIKADLRYLILFPTTGEKILHSILEIEPNGHLSTNHYFAKSMAEAIARAHEVAQENDVVLLSPACASYNMFKNYEDRGNQFKELAQSL